MAEAIAPTIRVRLIGDIPGSGAIQDMRPSAAENLIAQGMAERVDKSVQGMSPLELDQLQKMEKAQREQEAQEKAEREAAEKAEQEHKNKAEPELANKSEGKKRGRSK